MNYRRLGRSGLQVSEVSFGSWVTFGSQVDLDAARACMVAAYDGGVNFFDNAEAYAGGRSEEVMGQILADVKWPRDTFVVSSKVFWGGSKPNQKGLSRKHVFEACHAALRRMRVDYLDLYFCHRPDPDTPVEETCWAMHQLVMAGKVLYWGTSMWSADEIVEAHAVCRRERLVPPTMEQPIYSMLQREKVEREYARLYERFGLGTTVFSPLAQGLLTGKYNSGVPRDARGASPQHGQWMVRDLTGPRGERVLHACRQLTSVADELGISMAHLAIGWVLKNPNVSTAIMGATRAEQVVENVRASDHAGKLTAEVLQRVEKILEPVSGHA